MVIVQYFLIMIASMLSNNYESYIQNDIPVFEWVNEQTYDTDLTISDLQLSKEILNNIDREIDFILITPKIIEKEKCATHDTIHTDFCELDDTCVDIQYYERDYSNLNSVSINFVDGTGYYWEK